MQIKVRVSGFEHVPLEARLHAQPPKAPSPTSMRVIAFKVESGYRAVTLEPLIPVPVRVGDVFSLHWGARVVADAEVVAVENE